MQYFSIHNSTGEHLGFLVMLPDEEVAGRPQSGRFAIKLQSEIPPKDAGAVRELSALHGLEEPFYWRVESGRVGLYRGEEAVGSVRSEFLTVGGQTFVLGDMTGMM